MKEHPILFGGPLAYRVEFRVASVPSNGDPLRTDQEVKANGDPH